MKKFILFLFVLTITQNSHTQSMTSKDLGFKKYSFTDEKLGTVDYYVTLHNIQKEKPLFVFIQGSTPLPLYSLIQKPDGSSQISTSITIDPQKLSEKYHVAILSKPGVPFIDSLKATSSRDFRKKYKTPKAYEEKLSLEWRVDATSKAINLLLEELPVLDKKVYVMGYSEGGQVVPKLALMNKNIHKIANIVGGGLNQFYDLILENRIKAQMGKISSAKAQQNIDSLYLIFEDIYKNPLSTKKKFWGDTYLRWSSFCSDSQLEDMTKLDIPILMITAGKDTNAPILGLDYVKLEFLRLGKTNLTYKVFPNCDHYFYDVVENKDRLDEVVDEIIKWFEQDNR